MIIDNNCTCEFNLNIILELKVILNLSNIKNHTLRLYIMNVKIYQITKLLLLFSLFNFFTPALVDGLSLEFE